MLFNFYLRTNSLQGVLLHHKTRCTGHDPIPSQHRGETYTCLSKNTFEPSVVMPVLRGLPILRTVPHKGVYVIVVNFHY